MRSSQLAQTALGRGVVSVRAVHDLKEVSLERETIFFFAAYGKALHAHVPAGRTWEEFGHYSGTIAFCRESSCEAVRPEEAAKPAMTGTKSRGLQKELLRALRAKHKGTEVLR